MLQLHRFRGKRRLGKELSPRAGEGAFPAEASAEPGVTPAVSELLGWVLGVTRDGLLGERPPEGRGDQGAHAPGVASQAAFTPERVWGFIQRPAHQLLVPETGD